MKTIRHINNDDGTFDMLHEQVYTMEQNEIPKIFCPLCGGTEFIHVDTPHPNSKGVYVCGKCKK